MIPHSKKAIKDYNTLVVFNVIRSVISQIILDLLSLKN